MVSNLLSLTTVVPSARQCTRCRSSRICCAASRAPRSNVSAPLIVQLSHRAAMHEVHRVQTACSRLRDPDVLPQVNTFYNLVTDFYEWGWGTSFHFSPQLPGKTQCAP